MKGTIDITIKRKDGTVEKRQEHNVAFDLPAFIIKEWLKDRCLPIYSSSVDTKYLKGDYSFMSLCEEERNLTKPEWRPRALKTVTSGSSLPWHTALASPTNDGKKRTITAAWTMPSDEGFSLTLKSIGIDNNYYLPTLSNYSNSIEPIVFTKGIAQSLTLSSSSSTRGYSGKKYKVSDFNFANEYAGGLDDSVLTSLANAMYMPYSLGLLKTVGGAQTRTNDGRFAFVNANNKIRRYPCPTKYTNDNGPYNVLEIFDDTTEQIVLRFPLSQFTNYNENNGDYTYVINTGTKNWLFQYDSSISASRIWQIPDTQTSDAIAPTSETFLQGVSLVATFNTDNGLKIIGNYIRNNQKVYKVNDDLVVTEFAGISGGSDASNTNEIPYLDKDYVSFKGTSPAGVSYISSGDVEAKARHGLRAYFANLTASNFSTPITLAAGDVLSVSYSISVGE